ncbi:MAG: hypothetical protein AB7R89_06090 [Dehalococcoidia bacterium]
MSGYRSHKELLSEYGSRCEYCLQGWPCDAVALEALARRALAVVSLADDIRRLSVQAFWDRHGRMNAVEIQAFIDAKVDAVLNDPLAVRLREEA